MCPHLKPATWGARSGEKGEGTEKYKLVGSHRDVNKLQHREYIQ